MSTAQIPNLLILGVHHALSTGPVNQKTRVGLLCTINSVIQINLCKLLI